MIGLILVSHSAALVEGLAELVAQMEPDVPLAVAGGTDDGELGTSLELVTAAIEEADHGDGAVILFDLGSAQMTAESALEFAQDDQRERLTVVTAPLVEGALAAAAAAAGGADLAAVAAAATDAGPESSGFDAAAVGRDGSDADGDDTDTGDGAAGDADAGDDEPDASAELELANETGLHARPASMISRAVRELDATIEIERADTGDVADASSTLRLTALGAPKGTTVVVRASGPDADTAVDRIRDLIERRFDEDDAD